MKILFLSSDGIGLGVAWRMQREGHYTYVHVRAPGFMDVGRGIHHTLSSWRTVLNDVDFVVADSPGYGQYTELFRQRGRPTFGINLLADALNLKKQAAFLKECDIRMCSKIEHKLTISGWFNGREWVFPPFLTLKENHLLPGDLGPRVGCMGCTVVPLHTPTEWLMQHLNKISTALKKLGLTGLFTIQLGRDEDNSIGISGVYSGLAFDIIEGISEGLKEPLTNVLFEISVGIKDEIDVTQDYIVVVRLTVPPWPYIPIWPDRGRTEIEGLSEDNFDHIYLCNVSTDEEGWWVPGGSGIVLKAAARGRTVREARKRVYRTLRNIQVENMQYRLDIGSGIKGCLETLTDEGVIDGIQYEEG